MPSSIPPFAISGQSAPPTTSRLSMKLMQTDAFDVTNTGPTTGKQDIEGNVQVVSHGRGIDWSPVSNHKGKDRYGFTEPLMSLDTIISWCGDVSF